MFQSTGFSMSFSAVCLGVVVCALIGVSIGLGVEKSKGSDDDAVCNTMGCVQLSAQIASRLNMSMDPCEDFVEFSCGGWRKNNVIPPGIHNYTATTAR